MKTLKTQIMPVRKKKPNNILMTILGVTLLILFLLKFDVVSAALDPTGKLGLAGFASDAFPIVMGLTLIVVGIAAVASPWVAIALIAVGVGLLASKLYSIWKRRSTNNAIKPE